MHKNNDASSSCLKDGYEADQQRCGISASSEEANVSLLFLPESWKRKKETDFFFIAKNLKLFSESIKNMQMFVKAEIFCCL